MSNKKKEGLHKNNVHKAGYDFKKLCAKYKPLNAYTFVNSHKIESIDFTNPKAVKALNTALLLTDYPIKFWKFPEDNLCPPIPGRADYIHHLSDLLNDSDLSKKVQILDIGTGASLIYPLLGNALFKWNFVATDITPRSLESAQNIIKKNNLSDSIKLLEQKDKSNIFNGILKEEDRFEASMCNPPFFASHEEVTQANERKQKGLKKEGTPRNFSGNLVELTYKGGEKAFLHNYLYQSSLFKKQCFWYTTLVSKKDNLKSMHASLEKLGAVEIKTILMQQGNKNSRIVAWTFLNTSEQKEWKKEKTDQKK